MVLDRYPQYLPGFMKLMNNYITESVKNENFRKTYEKDHIGVAFVQNPIEGFEEQEK